MQDAVEFSKVSSDANTHKLKNNGLSKCRLYNVNGKIRTA